MWFVRMPRQLYMILFVFLACIRDGGTLWAQRGRAVNYLLTKNNLSRDHVLKPQKSVPDADQSLKMGRFNIQDPLLFRDVEYATQRTLSFNEIYEFLNTEFLFYDRHGRALIKRFHVGQFFQEALPRSETQYWRDKFPDRPWGSVRHQLIQILVNSLPRSVSQADADNAYYFLSMVDYQFRLIPLGQVNLDQIYQILRLFSQAEFHARSNKIAFVAAFRLLLHQGKILDINEKAYVNVEIRKAVLPAQPPPIQ